MDAADGAEAPQDPRGVPLTAAALGDGPTGRIPGDPAIAVRPGRGRDTLRDEQERGARRQSLRGFPDGYTDIVDWIVRITHRIWEDQDVGYVYDTYAPGVVVHDDHGAHHGVERVVEGTIASIHAFPDLRSWADDVVWAGDEVQGFATSHRYVTSGHHLGAWEWGPATGRALNLWGIANCLSVEGEIIEEHVLYNTCSRLAQVGVDVADAARRVGSVLRATEADASVSEVERLIRGRHPEPYPPAPTDRFDVEHHLRALFHDVFDRRDLSAVDRAYARNVRWHGTSDRTGFGRADVKGWARALLATFPDLGLQVDEVYWTGDEAHGYRASVRWSAAGTHRGWALYGDPTGRRVRLWGISQVVVTGGLITEEWAMCNEFDVLARILADPPRAMLPRPTVGGAAAAADGEVRP